MDADLRGFVVGGWSIIQALLHLLQFLTEADAALVRATGQVIFTAHSLQMRLCLPIRLFGAVLSG